MNNISVEALFWYQLIPSLLCGLGLIGVLVAIAMRTGSWRKRYQYVALGGGLGFLFGLILGALMLLEGTGPGAMLVLILPAVVSGLLGAVCTFNMLWPSEFRRRLRRHTDDFDEGEQ